MDTALTSRQTRTSASQPREPLRLVGEHASPEAQDLRDFLARNGVPHQWVDLERDALVRFLLDGREVAPARYPVVLLPDGTRLARPSRRELAEHVGLNVRPQQPLYDLAIMGAGPAGLTAAVYAASEGLRTVVVERQAPGGQAGTSSWIENYLGFPDGISGVDLADRALRQAFKFGSEFIVANEVISAHPTQRAPFELFLADGSVLRCNTVIVATGVAYRLLDTPGVPQLTGRGISYGPAISEAPLYRDADVVVVGGGNSAGQAAAFLAQFARRVTMLVRGDTLDKDMSHYLVEKLGTLPNVRVLLHTTLQRAEGRTHLESIVVADQHTGAATSLACEGLFILIGQQPLTEWADGLLLRDPKGFLVTGRELQDDAATRAHWSHLGRDPLPLETSMPGVFAIGDVRRGSTKRVATAVGEGAMAAQLAYAYLRDQAAHDAAAVAALPPHWTVATRPAFLRPAPAEPAPAA